jgi:hypothetical protein
MQRISWPNQISRSCHAQCDHSPDHAPPSRGDRLVQKAFRIGVAMRKALSVILTGDDERIRAIGNFSCEGITWVGLPARLRLRPRLG